MIYILIGLMEEVQVNCGEWSGLSEDVEDAEEMMFCDGRMIETVDLTNLGEDKKIPVHRRRKRKGKLQHGRFEIYNCDFCDFFSEFNDEAVQHVQDKHP